MGPHEAKAHKGLKIWDALIERGDVSDSGTAHIVLSMLVGTLDGYDPAAYDDGLLPFPSDEEAEDWLNAVYVVLTHYETNRLARELNGD